MPLPLGEGSLVPALGFEPRPRRVLKARPLPVGLSGRDGLIGTPGPIRTDTAFLLREMPPTGWATGAWRWCHDKGSNLDLPHTKGLSCRLNDHGEKWCPRRRFERASSRLQG